VGVLCFGEEGGGAYNWTMAGLLRAERVAFWVWSMGVAEVRAARARRVRAVRCMIG